MTWPQVRQAAQDRALVLVPVGVIEEHGPHINLGADTHLTCLHSRRIQAALAEAGIKAVIAPPFYWGITDDTSQFEGSFNVRPETMTALIRDICQSLSSWGFSRVVFVNDHGNANHRRVLTESLARIRQELKLQAFSLDTMLTNVPVYQPPERPGRYLPDYHAGAAETAVVAREFPAEVDLRTAERLKPQSGFLPLGYAGDPASFRQENSLIDYFQQAPKLDALRIQTFFAMKRSEPATGPKEKPVQEIDPAARALIDQYLQALGGRQKLEAIRTQTRVGKLRDSGNSTDFHGTWSAEGKWLLVLEANQDAPERFGFNGFFGWHAERGRVDQAPEPLIAAISMVLDPQLALRLERQFLKLTPPREERSGERQVKVVEAEMSNGVKARLLFDARTAFLWKFNEITFEDYREVGGVLFPFAITIKPGTVAAFERMENNRSVDKVLFDPPK